MPLTLFADPSANHDAAMRLPEVMGTLGLSRASVYALIQKGALARPVKIGRTSVWLRSEVQAFLAARKAARDAAIGAATPTTTGAAMPAAIGAELSPHSRAANGGKE